MSGRKIEIKQVQEHSDVDSHSSNAPTDTSSELIEPPTQSNNTKTIEIKLAIPQLPKSLSYTQFKAQIQRIQADRRKKKIAIASTICAVGIFTYGGHYLYTQQNTPLVAGESIIMRDLVQGTPEYTTVLPTGKKIADLGGWTRVSPPDRNPVYTYVDRIGDAQINVSQQPLPDHFKQDTAVQVERLALSYNANEKISVGSTTVYIGTSSRGPQSVILTKKDVLILIKSSAKLSNDQWAVYINSLR